MSTTSRPGSILQHGKRRLYQSKDFVAIEIGAALARDIRVIPVFVDRARMPKERELPDSLKGAPMLWSPECAVLAGAWGR
jgi:hypothetical protein